VAAHPTSPKSTKPFILGYSVIAIVLHLSVLGKAYLSVCSVTALAYPKLEAKGIDKGWLKNIIRFDHIELCVIGPQLLKL
jgi:hypothetical protein